MPGSRWWIVAAAVAMQLALGGVNAWSVFRDPFVDAFGSSIADVTWAYTINVVMFGLSAFVGGLCMARLGPRAIGLFASVLFGLGFFLVWFAEGRLWVLYLGYGILAGIGRGFGYVVPITTAVSWFPDRRGLVAGIVIAANGVGGLVVVPAATALLDELGILPTFAVLGAVYLLVLAGATLAMRHAPEGFRPAGWHPSATVAARRASRDYTLGEALRTWQWYGLWMLLALNAIPGSAMIAQVGPMAREATSASVATAAGVVAAAAVANTLGRFGWAWLSDTCSRRWIFLAMLALQTAACLALPSADDIVIFTVLAGTLVLCFGGGLGTMPALAADYFGPKHVGSIFGLLLTGR